MSSMPFGCCAAEHDLGMSWGTHGPKNIPDVAKFRAAAIHLLENAHELRYLAIEIDQLLFIPTLLQLRHLQLSMAGSMARLALCLGDLVNLETLFLEQGSGVRSQA